MPAYILLAFSEDSIDLVVAQGDGPETLRIDSSHRFKLNNDSEETDRTSTPEDQASSLNAAPPDENKDDSIAFRIKQIISSLDKSTGNEVEVLAVVVRSRSMSFHKLHLPFKESNRLSQVVALQIQDSVPFELDEFLCASSALRQLSNGEYEILATLIPQAEVAQIVAFSQSIEIEPRVITTSAVALSYLPKVVYSYFQSSSDLSIRNSDLGEERSDVSNLSVLDKGLCVVVGQISGIFALAAILDGEPFDFREFDSAGLDDDELASEILCFAEGLSASSSTTLPIILSSLAADNPVNNLLIQRGCNLRSVLVSEFFDQSSSLEHNPADLAWAVSLLLTESRGLSADFGHVVNLRTGPFAYHPAFENVISALKEEAFWFIMAAMCLAFWVGVHIYAQNSKLGVVENAMESNIATVFGGEKAPLNGELVFVEDRLTQLEDQLRGLGSISSLSPLESLRELSETIGPGIDIEVDSLNIGYSKIAFRGSVPDFPSVGQLSSALEKNTARFCRPKVDSAGREPGTTRVKYSAEIELCE